MRNAENDLILLGWVDYLRNNKKRGWHEAKPRRKKRKGDYSSAINLSGEFLKSLNSRSITDQGKTYPESNREVSICNATLPRKDCNRNSNRCI